MKSIQIENIKGFTTQLFAGTVFDRFLAVEASFRMAVDYVIDGHLHADFLGEEEMQLPENKEGIIEWKRIRPICFAIVKGKKVPQQFKIIFKMPELMQQEFLRSSGLAVPAEQIGGLFLNINYKAGVLACTTGVSLKSFSLDKSLELQWDAYMDQFLKRF